MFYKLVCVISLLSLVTSASSPAFAVEPDAPESLITRDEYFSIMIRKQLRLLPPPDTASERSERDGLDLFYSMRQGRLLWVGAERPTERAWRALSEISRADEWGLRAADFDLARLDAGSRTGGTWKANALIAFEVAMSRAVLKYARQARGGRIDLSQVTTIIDRKPPLLSPLTVLTGVEASDNPAAFLRGLHPQHRQFHLLRAAYLEASSRERRGKVRTARYKKAVRERHRGKRQTTSKTPLSRRLLYNMEMWRWMPDGLGATHVWANIPEYKVRVVGEGRVVHQERMIVGKVSNMTPIFSDAMETVVFQPYWNVPNSIKVKELLPSLLRGGSALRRQNLRIAYGGREIRPGSIDWSRKDIRNYHVFQPPGRRNALGQVKFLFPNKHAVYMHDTPTKHLFRNRRRAFSHGCMRVRNPLAFAQVLLKRDRGWNRSRVEALAVSGPENNHVALRNSIPVHVTYFTARVSSSGEVSVYDDVYGHEARIQAGLDGKAITLPTTPGEQKLDNVRQQIIAGRGASRSGARRNVVVAWENRSALGATNPESRKPVRRATRKSSRTRRWRQRVLFQGGDR